MGLFEILAECSIAFAGLGAVHAVLRGSTGPRGVFRAWVVVHQGAVAFVLSVVPLVLAFAALPAAVLWRSASVFGLAGAAAAVYAFIGIDVQLARLGHPAQAQVSLWIGQLLPSVAFLAMLMNLIGWPSAPGPLLYAAAVILILISGLVALLASFLLPLRLVLGGDRSKSSSDDPPAA